MTKYTRYETFRVGMCPPLSRRRFLSLCATGSIASLTGCSSTVWPNDTENTPTSESTQSTDGLVWQKKVQVELTGADSSVLADLLRVQFDRDRDEVFGMFDPEYVGGAVDGASVAISADLHDTLTNEFGGVNYKIKMGPVNDAGDHLHAQARRTVFNELPLAGHVSVEKFWVEATDDLRVRYVRPIETDPPTDPPTTVDVDRFDLGADYDGY